MNKHLFIQIFIVLAIVCGYFFIDFNKVYNDYFKKDALYSLQDKACDLHKSSCKITLPDNQSFELEIFPKDIPLMENLKFRIKSSQAHLDDLKLNVYATNMFMGDFILKFKFLGDGLYEASGTLPTCPVGGMKWNADINRGKYGARFQFQTQR